MDKGVRKLAQAGRGECSGRACPEAWRRGRQSWDSQHHKGSHRRLWPHACCGATLHLGLATSPRPALPVGFVPKFFSLWSHTPRECTPLACNPSKEGTIERASYRAPWHGLGPAAPKPSRPAVSAAASSLVAPSLLGTPMKLQSGRLNDA